MTFPAVKPRSRDSERIISDMKPGPNDVKLAILITGEAIREALVHAQSAGHKGKVLVAPNGMI
jgi:hypothetical protein